MPLSRFHAALEHLHGDPEVTDDKTRETLGFQAEVRQLLKLMIHSLYSNKEIFLRELISNASDAADKLRFEALARPDLLGDDRELTIVVAYDNEARTVSVSDNGIGMSRDELVKAPLGVLWFGGPAAASDLFFNRHYWPPSLTVNLDPSRRSS